VFSCQIRVTRRVSLVEQELLTLSFISVVHVVQVVKLQVYELLIPWCNVRCDFCVNTMFGSFLPIFVGGLGLIDVICIYLFILVSNTI
jgi:hypothetical protein